MSEQEQETPADWDIARLYRKPPAEELEYFHLLEIVNLDEVHPFVPYQGGVWFRTHVMVGGLYFRTLLADGSVLEKLMLDVLRAGKKPGVIKFMEGDTVGFDTLETPEAVQSFVAVHSKAQSSEPAYTLEIPYEELISLQTHD